jgi:hypothetical protein
LVGAVISLDLSLAKAILGFMVRVGQSNRDDTPKEIL